MAKLWFSAFPVLLLAALQPGCALVQGRADVPLASPTAPNLGCDTTVKYIPLVARLRNTTNGVIEFYLQDDHVVPYGLWYLGYRVHSGAPGAPLSLVHNANHGSIPTRRIRLLPGDAADFDVPIFGLGPGDYRDHFRIELRDSDRRSYWSEQFDLCDVQPVNCGCPPPGGVAIGLRAAAQACPATASRDRCD
jgi:hypothetical protein